MKFNKHILLCIAVYFILISCNDKNERIVLESSPLNSSITAEKSSFCIPVQIPLSEFEKVIDKKVKRDIIVDKELGNNIIINAKRTGRITLQGYENNALISVPLDVSVRKGVNFNLLTVDFKVELQILSEITIDSDYNINSKSEVHEIIWLENPEINILGLEIDLQSVLDKALDEKKDQIARTIDDTLDGKINVKRAISRVWQKMQKPQNIIKKTEDSAFIFINPISVNYISHTIHRDYLEINLKSVAHFSLKSSYSKPELEKSNLPRLNKKKSECNGFAISLLADLSFNDLNEKLNSILNGKSEDFEGYKIKFESCEIKPSGQDLYIKLKVGGSYHAEMEGLVAVNIDTINQKIHAELKEFNLLDGDIQLELANMVFGDFILDQLNKYRGFNYAEYLNEIPNFITKGIENGKSGEKWHPVFERMSTKVKNFEITEEGIYFQVLGEGSGRIVIEQLKTKAKHTSI